MNKFNAEQLAFMKAYSSNVADAEPDIVALFLEMEDDHDGFYKLHSEYYSGLADARGVWNDAIQWASKAKPEPAQSFDQMLGSPLKALYSLKIRG
jgi:hypothetical protein